MDIIESDTGNEENKTILPTLAIEIVKGLGSQLGESFFVDVTVICENTEFKCHRVILAACSGFFRAVLSCGMKEDLERRVELKEISSKVFSEILEYVYKGKSILKEENMFDVWHAANLLQILFLLKDSIDFMKQNMSVNNCLAIYQTSKLLDCQELITFSWNYILQEFESLRRSQDILFLTSQEMKLLLSDTKLKTKSEDSVAEIVLKWVDYTPLVESDISSLLEPDALEDSSTSVEKNSQTLNEDPTSQNTEQNNSGDDSQPVGNEQQQLQAVDHSPAEKHEEDKNQETGQQRRQTDGEENEDKIKEESGDNKKESEQPSRASCLSDLLRECRVCLLSGKCLMHTVGINATVKADKKALEIVQEGIQYHMNADRRHDACPHSGIHRTSSNLTNIILGFHKSNQFNSLSCVKLSEINEWFGLGKPLGLGGMMFCYKAMCYDDKVYVILNDRRLAEFNPFYNQWKELPTLHSENSCSALLSIGYFFYIIINDDCHSVQILNINDTLDNAGDKWEKIGALSTTGLSINGSTVVDDKIVILGSKGGIQDTVVECFDTTALESQRLDDIPGTSSGLVTFRKGPDAFVLKKNGALWKISPCPNAPFVEVSYQTLLWDFDRDLAGALVCNDELFIFGPSFSLKTSDMDKSWEIAVPGVFKRINNIECSSDYHCFHSISIPKKYLTKKVSVT